MGSKVLVTTRNEEVAKTPNTPENGIHRLGVLSDEACWLLLQRIALCGRSEGDCAQYKDVGMKIVHKCKGLPLAAKTLGGLLCGKNSLEEWENVLHSETWELEKIEVELFPHLLLSYNELSPSLKRCFSYCAVFPKDTHIKVEEVIRRWMALGYLGSDIGSGGGDMELRGRQYFDNLAMRSLFQDFEKDENDGEKIMSFKLHDIVHDFSQYLRNNSVEAGTKTKTSCQACSPQLVSQVKEYRSCLKWKRDSRKKTICSELYNLQTLLLRYCNLQGIPRGIGNLINLRHLDLSHNQSLEELPMKIWNLINLRHLDLSWNKSIKELPREIGNLINLRHLDLSWNKSLKELPESICDLRELQTLNIELCDSIPSLPQGIHHLVKLKHLHNYGTDSIKQFPQGLAHLTCLRALRIFRVGKDMGRLGWLKNLNRLRSLELRISLNGGLENTDVEDAREGELRNKEYLQTLDIFFEKMRGKDEVEDCVRIDAIDALQPHPNLQILSISWFKGSRLPGWIASPVNQVKYIRLSDFDNLLSLPPLGILPCLEEIEIISMHELRQWDVNFLESPQQQSQSQGTPIVLLMCTFPS
ncbi:putative disease resistance protein rga3 [Phtheirospermum japonicum]|uniref:Putative disease resistance protein rga3 n=1 Tax=Phtheirospermum japonicum TaxID=374723 RepID=A0A830C773_9LAMI|nr:putative disease resistance protein rga3 [Phtheirospermum japonicum]